MSHERREKRFHFGLAVGLLTFLVGLDLITKQWGYNLEEPIRGRLLQIIPVKNFGLIFGSFAQFRELVRVVFFSTLGGYALALYFVLLYFFQNKRVYWLKLGLTVFVAGIMGNVIDKTLLGFVRDFINLPWGPFKSYAFNLADMQLMAGTIITIICIYSYGDELWNENNNRKTYLIDKPYQLTLAFWNVSAVLLVCTTLSLFSYSFLKSYVDPQLQVQEHIYQYFFLGIFLIVSVYCFIFFLFTLILSHRSVGPMVALRRYIRQLKAGNFNAQLQLRENDFHKDFEGIAETLKGFNVDKMDLD
jgi:signal peptidase II